jgi:hypothetical protein
VPPSWAYHPLVGAIRDREEPSVFKRKVECSFCGKNQKQVKHLIAGPGVYICDECVDLSNEVIEEAVSDWPWQRVTPSSEQE